MGEAQDITMTEIASTATTKTGSEAETQALTTHDWINRAQLSKVVQVDITALEMGVKCTADLVFFQELPKERGSVGICHLAYELRNKKHFEWQ
jgi:hypothetical protein